MDQLIKIDERKGLQTVNARELHAFLEVGKVFAAWIQERIAQYGFVEHQDYEVFSKSGKNSKGGRPTSEYAISIDMAKELAMVERTEKGKQARQYFIACEKKLKEGGEDWKRLRHVAASSYKVMSQLLQETRELEGKSSKPHHFMNEAKLINASITGEFKGIDRDSLSIHELDLLGQIEIRNTILIARGFGYEERKKQLQAFAAAKLANSNQMALEVK
nr:MAG TPA: AntA/AntB antirepressor [Herelleviridae sp.]